MNDIIHSELKRLAREAASGEGGFAVTSLRAGYPLAMMPVSAQAITTPADGLVAGEVKVPVKDGLMPAYRAMPEKGNAFPAILVTQEIFGVHDHIKDICRRLAHAGYFAIAPELYARQGDASAYSDIPKLVSDIVSKVGDAQVNSDFDACVAYAKSTEKADVSRLGITGFCWGGRIAMTYAAHNPKVRAAVPWYGPTARSYHEGDRTAIEVAPQIKGAVLGLFGGADAGIPNETVERMFAALKAAGNAKSECVIYPDTPHAFFADYRPNYRPREAEDGWRRMLAWFKSNLG